MRFFLFLVFANCGWFMSVFGVFLVVFVIFCFSGGSLWVREVLGTFVAGSGVWGLDLVVGVWYFSARLLFVSGFVLWFCVCLICFDQLIVGWGR